MIVLVICKSDSSLQSTGLTQAGPGATCAVGGAGRGTRGGGNHEAHPLYTIYRLQCKSGSKVWRYELYALRVVSCE